MPKLLHRNPAYRKHRASGQAIVTIDGHDHYLGPYGTRASRGEYDRVIAEWLAAGRHSPVPISDLTIAELMVLYLEHCRTYYRRPDGTPTNETDCIIQALRPLKELYSRTRAADFGPLALKTVRQRMIEKNWARTRINMNVGRIKRFFRWATENEKVPASVLHGLQAVQGLRAGRSEAKESEPVTAVAESSVGSVIPFMHKPIDSMVRLQLLTGMRPGEICGMRGCDLDTTGSLWLYKPGDHKTRHHGHERIVYLGAKAQALINDFLKTDLNAYLFSPSEAQADRLEAMHAARRTPISCGNRPGSNRKRRPKRRPGDRYEVTAYNRAVSRACEKAFPPPEDLGAGLDETEKEAKLRDWRAAHHFHVHQLRHTAATMMRKSWGLEAAQVLLGHRNVRITETYAEKNIELAKRFMSEFG